jgi:hypothetical protein
MRDMRRIMLVAVIAFAAAIGGVFAGRAFVGQPRQAENELHGLLHDQLKLSVEQHAGIDALEKKFAIRKQALELEMRADNAKLAGAIEAEHGYGAQVSATIDHSHLVMGELQKETLEHIFAMRQVLKPDQAVQFDRAVVKALTQDAH